MSKKTLILSAVFIVLCSAPSFAEIERIALIVGNGICPHWWPRIEVPKGWHQDKAVDEDQNLNMLVQDGFDYKNSDAVIYSNAVYKKGFDAKDLDEFISHDHEGFLKTYPNVTIQKAAALRTSTGQILQTYKFVPKTPSDYSYELVSYGVEHEITKEHKENDYYLVFTLSAHTQKGYDAALPAFKQIVQDYK